MAAAINMVLTRNVTNGPLRASVVTKTPTGWRKIVPNRVIFLPPPVRNLFARIQTNFRLVRSIFRAVHEVTHSRKLPISSDRLLSYFWMFGENPFILLGARMYYIVDCSALSCVPSYVMYIVRGLGRPTWHPSHRLMKLHFFDRYTCELWY